MSKQGIEVALHNGGHAPMRFERMVLDAVAPAWAYAGGDRITVTAKTHAAAVTALYGASRAEHVKGPIHGIWHRNHGAVGKGSAGQMDEAAKLDNGLARKVSPHQCDGSRLMRQGWGAAMPPIPTRPTGDRPSGADRTTGRWKGGSK